MEGDGKDLRYGGLHKPTCCHPSHCLWSHSRTTKPTARAVPLGCCLGSAVVLGRPPLATFWTIRRPGTTRDAIAPDSKKAARMGCGQYVPRTRHIRHRSNGIAPGTHYWSICGANEQLGSGDKASRVLKVFAKYYWFNVL